MVKIRLTRGGARKHAYYRVIAIDERARRDGRALEVLGAYDPMVKPASITLNTERIEHWVGRGAQLSKAVQALFKRARKQAQAPPEQAAQKRRAKTTRAKRKKEEAAQADAQAAAQAAEAKAEAPAAAEAEADAKAADADAKAGKADAGKSDAAEEAGEKESSG